MARTVDATPLDGLRNDHRGIRLRLVSLQQALADLQFFDEVGADLRSISTVKEVFRFLETDLVAHIRREEKELYQVVAQAPTKERKRIDMVEKGHDAYVQALAKLRNALYLLEHGENLEEDIDRVKQTGEQVGTLLWKHMDEEEQYIFPLAEARLAKVS